VNYGLPDETITAITSAFAQYPTIDKAILYGSRAIGTYKNGSDIDLTLCGENLTVQTLQDIMNTLDDLLLPYTIDLSLHSHLDNPALLEHVQRVGVVFYEK